MKHRFFTNRLPDWGPTVGTLRSESNITLFQKSLKQRLDSILAYSPDYKDPTVYTGSSGIAYMCYRVASKQFLTNDPLPLALLRQSLAISKHALQSQHHHPNKHQWSLPLGNAGSLLVNAIICNQLIPLYPPQAQPQPFSINRQLLIDERNRCISDYLNLHTLTLDTDQCQEDEFLYGRSGYLFGCLLIKKIVSSSSSSGGEGEREGEGEGEPSSVPVPPPTPDIETITHNILTQLLTIGRQISSSPLFQQPHICPLLYIWPPGRVEHSPPYLGGAHGLMGILYTMLHFPHHLTTIPGGWIDVVGCLDFILRLECDDTGRLMTGGGGGVEGEGGHYPSHVMIPPEQQQHEGEEKPPLVQWCHGAPGAVFLYTKAHECLEDKGASTSKYLEAAERSGEAVWKKGLLTKGPGLCHGISGSGYTMLRLYKFTKKDKWLHRAIEMAKFMASDEFKNKSRVPDRPLSLFEGWGGAVCLYADLLEVMTMKAGEKGEGGRDDVMERVGFPMFEV
jgi:hypothetical protein